MAGGFNLSCLVLDENDSHNRLSSVEFESYDKKKLIGKF